MNLRQAKSSFSGKCKMDVMSPKTICSSISVNFPYGPEIFFRSYLQLLVSVVSLAARIF